MLAGWSGQESNESLRMKGWKTKALVHTLLELPGTNPDWGVDNWRHISSVSSNLVKNVNKNYW